MLWFAMVAVAIMAIVGIFRWKRVMENPIKAMARTNTRAFAGAHPEMFEVKSDDWDESIKTDDVCTDPAYSSLLCNVWHNDDD